MTVWGTPARQHFDAHATSQVGVHQRLIVRNKDSFVDGASQAVRSATVALAVPIDKEKSQRRERNAKQSETRVLCSGQEGRVPRRGFDFHGQPFAARLAEAQSLMRQAGYGPANRLTLIYATTTSPDNRRMAAVLQAMLSQIYVTLTIRAADVPNHFRSLRAHDYDLGIANWYADFNDASNFLDLLRSHAGSNYAAYRNPAFDRLMDAAAAEPDAARRGLILAQAEKTALADYPWIPLRFPAQTDLVAPGLGGWVANARDLHRSRWLAK